MRSRLTYANVTATLALVLAMSGGAMAASHYLINSTKQINPKVLKKLKGNTGKTGLGGKDGAAGKEGPQGPEGKPGPSEAISSRTATVAFPGSANAADSVRAVTLPAGSYTLGATVTANNAALGGAIVECILYDGATTYGEARATLAAKSQGDLALSGVLAPLAPIEVKMACKSSSTEGSYESPTLTAIRAGSLG